MLIIIFPRALKQGVQRRWTEPKDLIFVPFDGGKVLLECLVYIKMLGNTPLAPLKGGMRRWRLSVQGLPGSQQLMI